jgi:lysophospholipase L1-like esterase/fibronectin type 3 domain-containing protein
MGAVGQGMSVAARRRVVTWLASAALVAASLVGLAASPAEAAAVAVTPTRIMPLGDSITWGTGGDGGGGYRPPLVQSQVAGRYSADMVGSQRSGPTHLYDRDHEGYRGYRIDQLSALVRSELTTYRPEFVLLQIGTNDVLQQYQLATAPDRLSTLIDLITDAAPSARLVVASITPLADPALDADAQAYNAAIPDIVAAKAATGGQVSFLDMHSRLTAADLVDGIHPGQGGYDKMAAAWNERLVAMEQAPPPVSTRSCPCSIWSSGDAPVLEQVTSTIPAEVGVKFRTEKDGFIGGVRFYKGADNTGTHVGSLWTATGTLLASATFTDETSSGWQQVLFEQPVPVQAHTVYIASYFAPVGRYAADKGYFREREVVHSPLRLPSQGAINGNGVIRSGGPGLPTTASPQHDTNYWVDVVFRATASTVPAAPASLTATAVSTSQVDLSWSAVADATGYRAERSTNGAAWTPVATTTAGVTSHSDTGLAPATTYHYRVVATSAGGDSPPSPVATATTEEDEDLTPPSVPTELTAAWAKKRVNLSWSVSTDAGGSGLAGYVVWRSTAGASGSFTAIATTVDSVYSDTSTGHRVTYWYRVTAVDNAGNQSQPSNVVAVTPK